MLRSFLNANIAVSNFIDRTFGDNDGRPLLKKFVSGLQENENVADVGGGKKPALTLIGSPNVKVNRYDGFDIDKSELKQAEQFYSETFILDLTKTNDIPSVKYDKVICISTLEHVNDTESAIKTLSLLLKPGGEVYIKIPNRRAIFTVLNRILDNDFKRKILHYVFPNKSGDGFIAYYDRCTPSEIISIGNKCNMRLIEVKKYYRSSYFYFFTPLYLLWRFFTILQMVDRDYSESVEFIFRKS